MTKCKQRKYSPWLVVGVITGFLLGCSYFAIGVCTHTKNKARMSASDRNLDYDRAGTTR